jgi:ABC-type xylose transport system permease subunit
MILHSEINYCKWEKYSVLNFSEFEYFVIFIIFGKISAILALLFTMPLNISSVANGQMFDICLDVILS